MRLEFDIALEDLAEQIIFWTTLAPQDCSYLYRKIIQFIVDIDNGLADQEFTDMLQKIVKEL